MKKTSNNSLRTNEQGIMAIVIALLLIIVMSLIVLAMSQNARREQRQTLDRQLSDQAFYNAETGINDLANYLYKTPTAAIANTDCSTVIGGLNRDIDGATGVNKYTCLLYDKAPKVIQYEKISISAPRVIPIQTINDAGATVAAASLTLSWDDSADRDGNVSSCGFTAGSPNLPADCSYGGLRTEITSPSVSRDILRSRSFIAFLLPSTAASSNIDNASLNTSSQGLIDLATCTGGPTVRRCTKTITNVNSSNLFLTLRSLYRPVSVSISGVDSANNAVRFKDTQIMIDSTGRANDILRRVQVRIPANSQVDYPGFGIQSTESICKVLNVTRNPGSPGNVSTDNPTDCPVN